MLFTFFSVAFLVLILRSSLSRGLGGTAIFCLVYCRAFSYLLVFDSELGFICVGFIGLFLVSLKVEHTIRLYLNSLA